MFYPLLKYKCLGQINFVFWKVQLCIYNVQLSICTPVLTTLTFPSKFLILLGTENIKMLVPFSKVYKTCKHRLKSSIPGKIRQIIFCNHIFYHFLNSLPPVWHQLQGWVDQRVLGCTLSQALYMFCVIQSLLLFEMADHDPHLTSREMRVNVNKGTWWKPQEKKDCLQPY